MKNLIKKLAVATVILGLMTAQILSISAAFAAGGDTATPAADNTAPSDSTDKKDESNLKPSNLNDLKNLEFKVQDYLKLPGDKQAQSYFDTKGDKNKQTKFPTIKFILDILDTLVKLAGTIAVLLLIITGFVMLFSGGDQNKIEKAKQMFGQIIIGLAVILLSYILVTIVQSVFTT
jgi:hypothetical protein